MTAIASILLVPSPEHAEALLREGPCGARPPMAQFDHLLHQWTALDEKGRRRMDGSTQPKALVLAFESRPVPEGIDRAQRVRNGFIWGGGKVQPYVEQALSGESTLLDVVCKELGTLVFLDNENREIKP